MKRALRHLGLKYCPKDYHYVMRLTSETNNGYILWAYHPDSNILATGWPDHPLTKRGVVR